MPVYAHGLLWIPRLFSRVGIGSQKFFGGGARAGAPYTLTETAKLNDIDPQAWLADLLARLLDYPAKRISDLLPWNWRPPPVALIEH